jgi:hypothetical protein
VGSFLIDPLVEFNAAVHAALLDLPLASCGPPRLEPSLWPHGHCEGLDIDIVADTPKEVCACHCNAGERSARSIYEAGFTLNE